MKRPTNNFESSIDVPSLCCSKDAKLPFCSKDQVALGVNSNVFLQETLWYVILDKLEKSNKTVAKFTYI